jgi:hypothetical protein
LHQSYYEVSRLFNKRTSPLKEGRICQGDKLTAFHDEDCISWGGCGSIHPNLKVKEVRKAVQAGKQILSEMECFEATYQ